MTRVLFICHGNICRSPMAEFVLKDMVNKRSVADLFHIASAATSTEELGSPVHRGTLKKLKEVGIPAPTRYAVQLKASDYDKYDYFLCMDSANIRNTMRIFGSDPDKKVCRLLDFTSAPRDIADPWYTGDFDQTYADICEGCTDFLSHLSF